MLRYSEEFKLNAVNEYLEGPLAYIPLAEKYGIPEHSLIHRWVHAFRNLGPEGLKRKRAKTHHSVQFKSDVLHFIQQTVASHSETAVHFGLSDPSLISGLTASFMRNGAESLIPKSKERFPMSKGSQKKTKNQVKSLTHEQKVERENELLHLEVAYLKKLKAFQENPEASLEKHKQRWHSNLNKNSD